MLARATVRTVSPVIEWTDNVTVCPDTGDTDASMVRVLLTISFVWHCAGKFCFTLFEEII